MRWFILAPGHLVLEFPPVDSTGRALELHVQTRRGRVQYCWRDEHGRWCGWARAGRC